MGAPVKLPLLQLLQLVPGSVTELPCRCRMVPEVSKQFFPQVSGCALVTCRACASLWV